MGIFSSPALAGGTVGIPIRHHRGEDWWGMLSRETISSKELDPDKLKEAEGKGVWSFLKMSFRVGEKSEIYGKIGVSRLEGSLSLKDRIPLYGIHDVKLDVKLAEELALAVGWSNELWREEATALHLGGEVRWTEPDVGRAKLSVPSLGISLDLDPAGRKAEMWEWQVSLAVSREFEGVVPYVGLRYSDSDVDFETITLNGITYDLGEGKNKNNIGGFVGLNLVTEDGTFALSFEGRYLDEEAWTIAFHWGW